MGVILVGLGITLSLGSFGCMLLVLKEAWEDEVWKALAAFFIPIYLLFYAIAEFDHDYKWWIVAGYLFGGGVGGTLIGLGLKL